MGNGTIANLSVKLSASIGGFTSGMRSAVAPLQQLGSAVTSVAGNIFSLTGLISSVAAGGGLILLARNASEAIDSTAKLSDRLGVSTEALVGLQHAAGLAGIGAEELTGGLEKLLKNVAEAATSGGPAAAAFARIGLDAKKLANESPDQVLQQIADGLSGVHNTADRAGLAVEIFGKSGQQLLPLLMSGSQGIKAMEADAAKLGLTFSRVDAAKVEQANDAMSRLQSVFTGAVQNAVISLAPFIEAAANKLTDMGTSGQGAAGVVVTGVELILLGIAKMADWLNVAEAGWQGFQAITITAAYATVKGLSLISEGLDWVLKKLGMTDTGWSQTLSDMSDSLATQIDDAATKAGKSMDRFQQGVNSQKVTKLFDDIRAKANETATATAASADKMKGASFGAEDFAKKLQLAAEHAKKIDEILDNLDKDVATFGMNDADKKLYELQAMGADVNDLAEAMELLDEKAGLENAKRGVDAIKDMRKEIEQFNMTDAQKKVSDLAAQGVSGQKLADFKKLAESYDALKDAKDIIGSLETPLDKYEQSITKLNNALSHGAINWQQYGKGVANARAELESSSKAPDLLRAGSAEAQKALYHAPELSISTRGIDQLNGEKGKVDKQQLEESQKQTNYQYYMYRDLQTIADASTNGAVTTVDF